MNGLSHIWQRIQNNLFPHLEEILDPLTEKQKKLVAILELIRIENFVPAAQLGLPGRPPEDRQAIARAFIAKMVYNFSTTVALIEQLRTSTNVRRICGWEHRSDIPSETSFSRAFAEFANTSLPEKVHAALIEEHEKPRVVGHLSRDSTAIEAREKPIKRDTPPDPQEKKKRGRPKNGEYRPAKEPTRLERQAKGMSLDTMLFELPTNCDVGSKRNSKGTTVRWIGYKIHIDWADGEIPISCVLTSASVHDSQVAIPLAQISAGRVTNLYDLMDSAYDAPQIREQSVALGHVPIIDQNPRRGEKIEKDAATARRYNERTTAERGNSLLKDCFGGRTIRVRGYSKIFAHLMFGILALSADRLLNLLL